MQADLQAARPCCSRPQPPVVASSPGGCSAREARPDTQPGCCKEMEGTNKNKQWWLSTDWTFNTCKKCTTRPLWKFTQVSDVLTITFYRTHTQRAHAHTHTHTHISNRSHDAICVCMETQYQGEWTAGEWKMGGKKTQTVMTFQFRWLHMYKKHTMHPLWSRFLVCSHSHNNVLLHTHTNPADPVSVCKET